MEQQSDKSKKETQVDAEKETELNTSEVASSDNKQPDKEAFRGGGGVKT